jgi:hypothetical protein
MRKYKGFGSEKLLCINTILITILSNEENEFMKSQNLLTGFKLGNEA